MRGRNLRPGFGLAYFCTVRHIREYTEDWANGFREIARILYAILPRGCRVHHVGSTSVPGMPAKDIIDIDIEYPQDSMREVIERLSEAGYDHRGNRGVPMREAFAPRDGTHMAPLSTHHLYACESGSSPLRDHLAFRDYLLAHPERACWLAAEKRRADSVSPTRTAYIDAKAAAYEEVLAEAVSWWRLGCRRG
ncbi:MAG: GrpB family protein [Gammaproteobacteria bacterium]|nr:GrpB family protein [Gammaproteobacteria bacterium]